MNVNDADGFEIDFTDFDADVTQEMREAELALWRDEQDARRRAEDDELAAARDELDSPSPVALVSETSPLSDFEAATRSEVDTIVLPVDFDQWTESNQVNWAWPGDDVSRWEVKERQRLYADWDASRTKDVDGRVPVERRPSSWDDQSLDDVLAGIADGTLKLPRPTVGMVEVAGDDEPVGLLYAGRVNGLAAESGAGKGWMLMQIGLEQMRLGRHFWLIDFEDTMPLAGLRLVSVLGADPDMVRRLFHYVAPTAHELDAIESLVERVASHEDSFVAIDSVGESSAIAGLSQMIDEDMGRWFAELPNRLAFVGGACVLVIDHLVKSLDGGLWPTGSQRKRAAISGVQLIAEVIESFSEDADGMVALKVAKDRNGARQARSVASYVSFTHPVEAVTDADGDDALARSQRLVVTFGPGKDLAELRSDDDSRKVAKAVAAMDADVASLDKLDSPPKTVRDVQDRMRWSPRRASAALKEWRLRQHP